MLQSVEFISTSGFLPALTISDKSLGYIIRDIQGLDPGKATIVTSDLSRKSGGVFQHARRESRNIVFTIDLDSRYGGGSVAELRRTLYRALMPEQAVKMRFTEDDGSVYLISGYVESFDAPLFERNPRAQISILCPDPDFLSEEEIRFTGAIFTSSQHNFEIVNPGSVDSGFLLVVQWMPVVTRGYDLTIGVTHEDGKTQTISIDMWPNGNERAELNTNVGQKSFVYNNANRLWMVKPTSEWPTLGPGSNVLHVTSGTREASLNVYYQPRFGGL